MPKKAASKKTPSKKSHKKRKTLSDSKINRRREWRFVLPLPAKIRGILSKGKKFVEHTTVQNISSTGAYFCLDSGVVIGSKLNLVIDLPKELSRGENLKLCLGGLTVRLEEPDKEKKRQGVALRFHKDFKIIPEEELKKEEPS
ncbi:MAG: PilZ domain-containing protein [Candidatus Aminicenantes bacterium]|nr:PilZ domain-containing protein [Candidatus Aminicenantes bacterium]